MFFIFISLSLTLFRSYSLFYEYVHIIDAFRNALDCIYFNFMLLSAYPTLASIQKLWDLHCVIYQMTTAKQLFQHSVHTICCIHSFFYVCVYVPFLLKTQL